MSAAVRFIVAHPRRVLLLWVIVAIAAAAPAGQLQKQIGNGGYEVPGSQSQRVNQLTAHSFPKERGQPLGAVFRSSKPAEATLRKRAQALADMLRVKPGVKSVGTIYASRSETMVVLPFMLTGDLAQAQKTVVPLRTWVQARAGGAVTLIGEAAIWQETTEISKQDLSRAERVSLPITFVILVAAFLSVIAALIPLGLALVSLIVTFGALGLLTHLISTSVYVTNTAQLLGIGLSIDYSLFIVSRYRENLARGLGTREAVRDALQTTGRAVLVSGITVALGLSSLAVLGVGVFASMALGASSAAALAALGALTLVPAVLVMLGPRINRLAIKPALRAAERGGLWRMLGDAILRRRWPVLTVSMLILLGCVAPLFGARLMFAGADGLLPASNALRQTSDAVNREFGEGVLEPIEIMSRADRAERAGEIALHQRGIADVLTPEPGAHGWTRIYALPAMRAGTKAGDETVRRVRRALAALARGGNVFVGGQPAQGVDLIERVKARFPWMVLMACVLAFVLLLVALRSIIVPLKAVATNLLSVAATLGLVTLIFEDLAGAQGLAWFVPPFLFAIVFGLSMDYEIFLLSRVREEYDSGAQNDTAVQRALQKSGRPITLAAVVIMLVFLTSANTTLEGFRQLGVGMALAILLDATLVRCALVPAALAVLGDRNWWLPGVLARRMPTPARAMPTAGYDSGPTTAGLRSKMPVD